MLGSQGKSQSDKALEFVGAVGEIITLVKDDKKAAARLKELNKVAAEVREQNVQLGVASKKAEAVADKFDARLAAAEKKEAEAQVAWETSDADLAEKRADLERREAELKAETEKMKKAVEHVEATNADTTAKWLEMKEMFAEPVTLKG